MTIVRVLAAVTLCAVLISPDALGRGRQPGSRLIYPVHRSGAENFTILALTNTNPAPANQVQLGGSTFAHFEYYNTFPNNGQPTLTNECSISNTTELLTPADTFVVVTTCHNGEDDYHGQSGYVVVTAQDPSYFDKDWDFDYLVGSSIVVNASGGMYSINAVPFNALDDNKLESAMIPGDQIMYEPFPDILILDNFVALARSHLSLTAFMSDPNDVATIYFQGWNDNEQPMSTTFEMGCWFDLSLDKVGDLFTEGHLLGTGHDPGELDVSCDGIGTVETGWGTFDCIRVETPGGGVVDPDGVPLLGAITSGVTTNIDGGRLLWERGMEYAGTID